MNDLREKLTRHQDCKISASPEQIERGKRLKKRERSFSPAIGAVYHRLYHLIFEEAAYLSGCSLDSFVSKKRGERKSVSGRATPRQNQKETHWGLELGPLWLAGLGGHATLWVAVRSSAG